jgi:uncharacterized GH25 family protein
MVLMGIVTGLLTLGSTARAHEFIVKPHRFHVNPGEKVSFSVLAAHVFMISDEMEPLNTVKIWLLEESKKAELKLRENPKARTLDGEALLNRQGTAILVGQLEEPVETRAAQEGRPVAKIKREKFSKTLLVVGSPDKSYEKVLGHQLEIVPLSNPAVVRAGEELRVKLLLHGKPLNAMVFATYDGFSKHDNTYAYATESKEGVAHIKLTQPGTWMVRVENRREVQQKEFNQHVLKAVLVFSVP